MVVYLSDLAKNNEYTVEIFKNRHYKKEILTLYMMFNKLVVTFHGGDIMTFIIDGELNMYFLMESDYGEVVIGAEDGWWSNILENVSEEQFKEIENEVMSKEREPDGYQMFMWS